MKKFTYLLLTLAVMCTAGYGQVPTPPGIVVTSCGAQSLTAGKPGYLTVDVTGTLCIAGGGTAASGTPDTGGPLKVGGVYHTTAPTFTNGDRTDLQTDSRGSVRMVIADGAGNSRYAGVDVNGNLGTVSPSLTYNTTPPSLSNGGTSDFQITGAANLVTAERGSTAWAPGQVSVTNVATLIAAARPLRRFIEVTNLGTTEMYCGPTSGVTTSTGILLPGIKGASIVYGITTALYCITASSSQSVTFSELYDN